MQLLKNDTVKQHGNHPCGTWGDAEQYPYILFYGFFKNKNILLPVCLSVCTNTQKSQNKCINFKLNGV